MVASVLAIVGVAVILGAFRAQRAAPRPKASASGTLIDAPAAPRVRPSTGAHPTRRTARTRPSPSLPTSIAIPSIGIQSGLTPLGRNADGTVEVPASSQVAGWYTGSVTPGQVGPSVILGHIDSTAGPGVFYELGALVPGARVTVTRKDGTVATFRITGVREYPKDHFPTIDVYGDTPVPTIRLITCGGAFDDTTHHYLSNIVAFGQLI